MNIRKSEFSYKDDGNDEDYREEQNEKNEIFEDDCRQRADDIRATYEAFKPPY